MREDTIQERVVMKTRNNQKQNDDHKKTKTESAPTAKFLIETKGATETRHRLLYVVAERRVSVN